MSNVKADETGHDIARVTDSDERKFEMIGFIMGLRARGISDTRVLAAIEKVPRRAFVTPSCADRVHSDQALPIACGQTTSPPFVVGYMVQLLDLDESCKVLEIGTGSGYQTAIMACLARRVYTIERYRTLSGEAEARFAALCFSNITTLVGDGTKGWAVQAPFDRIIISASVPAAPRSLLEQLRVGGVMVAPIGPEDGVQNLVKITRQADGYDSQSYFSVRFVPLVAGKARCL